LQAEAVEFTPGSDHEVWSEGSFRVPAIYLNDWPDRYIHTHADALANIDATKLLRAAFIGAASAYYLAQLDAAQVPALWEVVRRQALGRTATALARRAELRALGGTGDDGEALLRFHLAYEQGVVDSIAAFAPIPAATRGAAAEFLEGLGKLAGVAPPRAPATSPQDQAALRIYRRNPSPKGPMTGFGYSYFDDQAERRHLPAPALLARQGLWGSDYAYEALNLVDGRRTVTEVRDALTAIYGPVPLAEVAEYLDDLRSIGVLTIATAGR
jgi:aminopeptidase YwaD